MRNEFKDLWEGDRTLCGGCCSPSHTVRAGTMKDLTWEFEPRALLAFPTAHSNSQPSLARARGLNPDGFYLFLT